VLFADVGRIGPDYLPGHAHADTLGFEFSLAGQRLIVDTGCSTYETGEERLRQRGTAAHNTVVIDGADSSEVWSSFRVARRARPHDVSANQHEDGIDIEGSHDGYRRLPGRVVHRRKWRLTARRLDVIDTLEGEFRNAVAGFLLAPGVEIECEADSVSLRTPQCRLAMQVEGGRIRLEPSTWHPEFGKSIPTTRIAVDIEGSTLKSSLSW
jgi:uncharacterized heparinase superfamily protein